MYTYDPETNEVDHETVPTTPTQEWADEWLREFTWKPVPTHGTKEEKFVLDVVALLAANKLFPVPWVDEDH